MYVSGPTSDGDGALDYDGTADVTGGVLIAAGSSGMAQNFGESGSTQGSILLAYSENLTGTVRVLDTDGTVLAEYTPTKRYRSVVVTVPGMTTGGTYTVEVGGRSQEVTLSNLIYGSSGMGGGFGGPGMNGGPMGSPGGQEGSSGTMGTPPEDGQGGTPPAGGPQGGPGSSSES